MKSEKQAVAGLGSVNLRFNWRLASRASRGRGFAALFLLSVVAHAADDDAFPGVEQLMTPDEFREAGLDKLTAEEQDALNRWLIQYTGRDAAVLQRSNEAVREAKRTASIESAITGPFTGWSGDTVFSLENGQVWQQRLEGRYRYDGPPNPRVRIERNFLGFYRLTLIEANRTVGVKLRR